MKRKPVLLLLAFFMLSGVFFTSCNEDELSQEEIIEQQQIIDFVVRVFDGSTANQEPLDSAVVKIINRGEIMEVSTGEDGLAIFNEVAIGEDVPVIITKTNYTSIYTTHDVDAYDYRQTVANLSLPLYSFESGEFVTVKGRLTAELDVTNREPEPVQGMLVKARQNGLSYANSFGFVDSTDADGFYEIKVPTREGTSYDDIELTYLDFEANQTIALEDEDMDGVYAVEQRPAVFRFNDNSGYSNEIPSIPSVWATVEAPTATSLGSGFEITPVIEPTSIALSIVQIINPGSGYDDGWQTFTFSPDSKDSASTVDIWVENGQLTDDFDNFQSNLAEYTTAPTLDLGANNGSGGQAEIFFRAAYRLIVSNTGSNYRKMPRVAVDITDVSWSAELNAYVNQIQSDDDINDNSDAVLNVTDILSDNAKIRNGGVDPYDGDTLDVVGYFTSAPVFQVFDVAPEHAMIEINYNDINSNDSTLTEITVLDGGSGYDPLNPPVVTLNVLAGYGSGAVVKAEVNANGALSFVEIIDEGEGYVQNVNDFRGNGSTGNTSDSPSYPDSWIYNITSGKIYIRDVYYGTGDPAED